MKTFITILLAAALVIPGWAIGGVHVQTNILLFGLLLATTFFLVSRRFLVAKKKTSPYHPIVIFFLFFLGLTCIQFLPLPAGLVEFLSPSTHALYQKILSPSGLYGSSQWISMSPAPGDTAAKFLHDLNLVLFFLCVYLWTGKRDELQFLMRVSVASAAVMALFVLVHTALRIKYPFFGFYVPKGWGSLVLYGSPFINPNHFGGFLLFNTFLAYTLLNSSSKKLEKILVGGASVFLPMIAMLTLSRGVILIFVVGFFVFLWQMHRISQEKEAKKLVSKGGFLTSFWKNPMKRVMLLVLVMPLGLTFFFGANRFRQEVKQTKSVKEDKLNFIWEAFRPFAKNYPRFGVGRGAQAMASMRYPMPSDVHRGKLVVSHVESGLLQPLVDWGLLFGFLFVAGFGYFFFRNFFGPGFYSLEKGAWFACALLLCQNLFDFNLEYLGTSMPFIAIFAALCKLENKKAQKRSVVVLYAAVAPFVLIGLVAVPFAWKHEYHAVAKQWKRLQQVPNKKVEKAAKSWMKYHSSNPWLFLAVARNMLTAKRWRPDKAVPLLDKVEYLHPKTHFLSLYRGYLHARLGLGEMAIGYFDKSLSVEPRLRRVIYPLIIRYRLVSSAISNTKDPSVALYFFDYLSTKQSLDANEKMAQTLLKKFPKFAPLYRRLALFSLRMLYREGRKGLSKEQLLQWRSRFAAMRRNITKNVEKKDGLSEFIRASLLHFQKNHEAALRLYKQIFTKFPQYRWEVLHRYATLLMSKNQGSELIVLFDKARIYARNALTKANIAFLEGTWQEKRFKFPRALELYNRSLLLKSNERVLLAKARVCWQLGELRCTKEIYQRLGRKKRYKYLLKKLDNLKAKPPIR